MKQSIIEFVCCQSYMDDISCLTEAAPKFETILGAFNNCSFVKPFTMICELDHSLAFLDVSLKRRKDGSVPQSI